MKRTDVVTWVYDTVVDVLDSTSLVDVTTPTQHVDIAEDRDDVSNRPYPFVAIAVNGVDPQTGGIGNDTSRVATVTYDGGVVSSVERARDKQLRCTVTVLTDGDRGLRTALTERVSDTIAVRADTERHPTDIDTVRVGEATPSGRPENYVYGDGIPLTIEYTTYITDDAVTAAETVNVDVAVSDDPTDDTPTTAYDETL